MRKRTRIRTEEYLPYLSLDFDILRIYAHAYVYMDSQLYILRIYILIYRMVLLKWNNKTWKHMDIIYTYVMYILYINVV